MKKRIINGQIIGPDQVLDQTDILIDDDRIHALVPAGDPVPEKFAADDIEIVDAAGGIVAPGFIDIHSDYIEHMAAPRPQSLIDFGVALHETERILMMHGITTMFHSMSFNDQTLFKKKSIRSPDYTRYFVELISRMQTSNRLIHHRFHARLEISSLHRVDEVKDYIKDGKVHLLSFTDHTPGQGQYWNVNTYRETLKGYRSLSEEDLDRIVADNQGRAKLTHEAMSELAVLARKHAVAVASHDDDTIDKLRLNRQMNIEISEFPIHMEVAHAAKEMGFWTVAGAPNVLLGGSHSGNLSAEEAIAEGVIDILCSDYYPASLLHAIFILCEKKVLDLPGAFRLVTLNPARAVKIDTDRGSLEAGKKADLLIIHRLTDGFPAVDRVMIDGKICMRASYRG